MMLKKQFKIAIYSGDIPSTTFIERLILGLSEKGHTIYLFGFKKEKVSYPSNIKVVAYKHIWLSKIMHLVRYGFLLFLFRPKAKRTLDKFLKQNDRNSLYAKVKYYPVLWHQPDIFHIQWAKSIGDWMWLQQFGTKIIVSLRGVHINYSPITIPKVAEMYLQHFPKVNAFHAVSKAIAVEVQKYHASAEKIHVIYSGLPATELVRSNAENATLKILSVGRSHWVKGYQYVIDACDILKKLGIDFQYNIIGGKESEELTFQIADLQLENNVQLYGQLPFIEVQKHMQEADVLLLSSLEEGIANVVLEAMQLGTLVVSTACGGMNEVITDGVNGFLVPLRNPEHIASTLRHITSLSRETKDDIINEAKRTIERQHTSAKMIDNMVALYQNVLDI